MPGALKVWDGFAWQTASASGSNTSVFVGPSAPAGSPRSGDLWYDTDEPSPFGSVIGVTNGGTGASNAPTARTNLSVPQIGQSGSVAGAPTTGTWARGDQWLDSVNALWVCTTGGTPGTWVAAQRKIQSAPASGTTDVNGRLVVTFPQAYTVTPVVVGSYSSGPIGMIYVDAITPTNATFRFFQYTGAVAASSSVSFHWIAVGSY